MSDNVVHVAEPPPPYSAWKSVKKAFKELGIQAASVVVLASGAWLINGEAVREAVKDIPGGLLLVPIFAGFGHALVNWWKHKDQ